MFKSSKSDIELWAAVRNNDGRAFDALFDRYWARLFKIASRQLHDEDDSLEIVHDIFLSLWTRRHNLEIKSVEAFLIMSMRYQVYSRLKPPKLAIAYKADPSDIHEPLPEQNLGEINIRDFELQHQLNHYLEQLPKRCHEIFHLSRIENLSNQEIANRLGISKKSVENQLTAALKHLRMAFKNIASAVVFFVFYRYL